MEKIERWGVYELALEGPATGNPFMDVQFGATFSYQHRQVHVTGFYDGDGRYMVRFSPDVEGTWQVTTHSNIDRLDAKTDAFTCEAPNKGNHGPVSVADTYHFAYADGTRYYQVGTTCYVWNHQGDALEQQTLATLAEAPFNKMRMCLFPKDYLYNKNEPEHFSFVGNLADGFDLTRFDPEFWRHQEKLIQQLGALGIEADMILFHPYDRWGFQHMPAETDDFYLRYAVARLAAYRNVWWSMANEFDLMRSKTEADWDRFFRIVQESDPYQRLRGVHNCRGFYDHNKPWVTHQSIQHRLPEMTREWRDQYKKPVVIDETQYEGNIPNTWGNIPPQEMVRKFWEGVCRGGYVGHGETYENDEDRLWWSKGGTLSGKSPARIALLRRMMEEGPQVGMEPRDGLTRRNRLPCVAKTDDYLLIYCGIVQPAYLPMSLPEDKQYRVEVIDTWEMTLEALPGTYAGEADIPLPAKPYIAIRLQSTDA